MTLAEPREGETGFYSSQSYDSVSPTFRQDDISWQTDLLGSNLLSRL